MPITETLEDLLIEEVRGVRRPVKVPVSLSLADAELLDQFATEQRLPRAVAARALVRNSLSLLREAA